MGAKVSQTTRFARPGATLGELRLELDRLHDIGFSDDETVNVVSTMRGQIVSITVTKTK